jgi:hypothetical protein
MMRISRRREHADRPVETGGYDGTKSAFADCARPLSRWGGRVAPHRIGGGVRRMEIGG